MTEPTRIALECRVHGEVDHDAKDPRGSVGPPCPVVTEDGKRKKACGLPLYIVRYWRS